ncbi:hypothetical protein D3C83_122340 [compost metagenome]
MSSVASVLLGSAAAAVEDRYSRDKLRQVEAFAAELFSRGERRSAFLRQRILDALALFRSRLHSLEMLRRASARNDRAASYPA